MVPIGLHPRVRVADHPLGKAAVALHCAVLGDSSASSPVLPRPEGTFPDDGTYVFPAGLAPVEIDHGRDVGSYWEPNVWIVHAIAMSDEDLANPAN